MMVVVLVVLVRAVSDEEMRTCQNISKLSPDGISLLSISQLDITTPELASSAELSLSLN